MISFACLYGGKYTCFCRIIRRLPGFFAACDVRGLAQGAAARTFLPRRGNGSPSASLPSAMRAETSTRGLVCRNRASVCANRALVSANPGSVSTCRVPADGNRRARPRLRGGGWRRKGGDCRACRCPPGRLFRAAVGIQRPRGQGRMCSVPCPRGLKGCFRRPHRRRCGFRTRCSR